MNSQITGTIVLYKNHPVVLKEAVNSFLNSAVNLRLYLVDNSPTNELQNISDDPRVKYIHNPANPGFGASHNKAIDLAIKEGAQYHFIINPDIYFNPDVVSVMVNYMESHKDVGMMMPEVLYPDGRIQYLPKLLPNPFWIIWRKIKKPAAAYQKFITKYELKSVPRNKIYNSPILSGCFTLLNLEAIAKTGGYDDRYFMYFEDFDLSRRVHEKYKTLYFPLVSVVHGYEGGANKSFKLFKIFLASAFHYFNKWGWFFDRGRQRINRQVLIENKIS